MIRCRFLYGRLCRLAFLRVGLWGFEAQWFYEVEDSVSGDFVVGLEWCEGEFASGIRYVG